MFTNILGKLYNLAVAKAKTIELHTKTAEKYNSSAVDIVNYFFEKISYNLVALLALPA
jgi:hypothetical protein